MTNERRVVITGCGVATPFGIGVESLWDGLIGSKSGIRPITAFDPAGMDSSLGAEVCELNARDYIPKGYRKSVKVMARDIKLAVACAYEAVKDAGLVTKCIVDRGESQEPVTVDPTRFGANIGAGLICADIQELAGSLQTSGNPENLQFDYQQWGREGMATLTPLWLLKFLPNMLGCHVTIVHDAQAPSNTITCGEASSHLAVGEAYRTIARGAADACICGGAESKMNPMSMMRQQVMGRLVTTHDEQPDSACKPFSNESDGMVASEGGGLLILEELEFAKARGARIYCEVAGFGAATKITSWHEPDPKGRAISLALQHAIKDANAAPEDVD
ncbi:MAG: beta-ketoacyl-[acyl-carrier-protein] synthase family protein, partial [Planctomycetes bacterium]|nr:beta-ketoacyl-[acyl-carrier-protein] synthase family protein [Planctomycetota bacterium]